MYYGLPSQFLNFTAHFVQIISQSHYIQTQSLFFCRTSCFMTPRHFFRLDKITITNSNNSFSIEKGKEVHIRSLIWNKTSTEKKRN